MQNNVIEQVLNKEVENFIYSDSQGRDLLKITKVNSNDNVNAFDYVIQLPIKSLLMR